MRVKDIRSGTSGSYSRHLTNVDGTLYFGVNDTRVNQAELDRRRELAGAANL